MYAVLYGSVSGERTFRALPDTTTGVTVLHPETPLFLSACAFGRDEVNAIECVNN